MPKLRINLAQRELEIEGDDAFIDRHIDKFDALFEQLERLAPAPIQAPTLEDARPIGGTTFGEFLHALPATASDVDRMLMSGWFVQRLNADKTFNTGDANRLLAEQGVKIGNPSQSVKQNLTAKRAFSVTKGRYRVSQTGTQHLNQLTGNRLGEG